MGVVHGSGSGDVGCETYEDYAVIQSIDKDNWIYDITGSKYQSIFTYFHSVELNWVYSSKCVHSVVQR